MPDDVQYTRLLHELRTERRKVDQLQEIVRKLHKSLSRRTEEGELPTPGTRKPTDAEERWVQLLWRMMPLADVAERTKLPYSTLIYWQSRGYIQPDVHWLADVHPVGKEERAEHAQYLRRTGISRRTVARYMRMSEQAIYKYEDAQ